MHEILLRVYDAIVREEMCAESVVIDRCRFDGAIFDLDGVLTDTARVHAAAWKATFDIFLQSWAQRNGLAFQPFDIEADYIAYVDGRPRYDGIRTFLAARGIYLPEGSEHDPNAADTVYALGERKTELFRQALQKGIAPAAGAEALLKKLRDLGLRTAMISSSKNATAVLLRSNIISMSVSTELTRRYSRCPASRIRHCFSRPPDASAFGRRVRSYSRILWLGWKPENGAVSAAW